MPQEITQTKLGSPGNYKVVRYFDTNILDKVIQRANTEEEAQ